MNSKSHKQSRHLLTVRQIGLSLIVVSQSLTLSQIVHASNLGKAAVGRQPDGSVVTSTNQVIRPAGSNVEFRGRPNVVAIDPAGRTAAFLTAYYKSVIVLDLVTRTIKQEFSVAGNSASFDGLVYSKDGKTLYASQSDQIIVANVSTDGTLSLNRVINNLPKGKTAYPGGLAISDDSRTLYVALNRNNSLGVFDLETNTFTKEIAVGNAPHSVVVSGNVAYVSNQGGRLARPGDFTNDSGGTQIVASRTSGRSITGTVSVVDLASGREVKSIEVGEQPTSLLLDGSRLFVTNTNSDSVSVINTQTGLVNKTIAVKPFHNALLGSAPNGLALMSNDRLVVSLGRNNALAVYELGDRMHDSVKFKGLIPTAWYPTSVVTDRQNGRLVVANGKGVGSLGPVATTGPDKASNKTGKFVHSNLGSASLIPFPNDTELEVYTENVYRNNHWENTTNRSVRDVADRSGDRMDDDGRREKHDESRSRQPVPLPIRTGAPSVFKHVFYIVKENRTYDQIFGALAKGNGDPSLQQFGREVTPNQHALAESFVLFDNLYDSGSNSADGHQWVTQANAPDYLEKSFGGFVRAYPFNAGDALAYTGSGFLWENATRHGKTARVYGEYISGLRSNGEEIGAFNGNKRGGKWIDFYRDALNLRANVSGAPAIKLEAHSDIPSLQAILNPAYPPYNQLIPDQYRAEVFLKEFTGFVKNGNLPNLVMMALTNDHTQGTSPNFPVPSAMIADNDLALGRIVEAISNSPYWKDSVIFVIEDDAQNGVDHVDGHRTTGFVISPYTKRGVVDSHYYTQVDFVRTIEQILGLPPMNQMDMSVEPRSMKNVFVDTPDLTPFKVRPNQIALDTLNPDSIALSGIQQEWAVASGNLNASVPDSADPELLNRVIWYATKGFDFPYPGDDRVFAPSDLHVYLAARQKARRQPDRD
ncbi:MAG: alkaline phosphatase family protein [Burkholderiaceae bacterium]